MKVPAVVIAAGESRRMGRLKPLLPLGSRTLLQWVVDRLREGGADPILVVLGHRADEVRECLKEFPVQTILNETYPQGMLSSVQAGARALPPDTPAFFVALGDQPDLDPQVLLALIQEWDKNPGSLVVPVVEGKRGHPILIDRCYLPALLALEAPQTLRDLVHAPSTLRREVPVETESLLLDLDTPEDYAHALRSGRFDAE
jgi:CTP:molybdopterin cytidylyltransferase MocA